MTSGSRGTISRDLERVFQHGAIGSLSEGQLLRQFVLQSDEVAFEALATRYGPMVLSVCRRMLRDPHEAADAFQATFLVLVRKAGSLRDAEQLGPWLHGVAFKVAARARSDSARRRDRERRDARPEAWEPPATLDQAELRGILDDELNRLPERYRRPIILCYMEGKTHEEAARRLRCTAGMLRGRLDRAREKLRSRLRRRGVAPSAAFAATAPGASMVTAAVPDALLEATLLTASRALVGRMAPATVSATVTALAQGVVRSALIGKLALAVSILALGGALLAVLPRALTREKDPQTASTSKPERGHPHATLAAGPLPGGVPNGVTLTGRVLDREGRPIPRARVGQGANRQEGATPEAVTDADGRFTFNGVVPGPVILTVQAAGRAPDLKSLAVSAGMEPVEFRLGLGRSIGGRLTDLAGKPIAGAPVSAGPWRAHSSLVWHGVTDADGRYRWVDAPEDEVLIDLGTMGYTSKRYLSFGPRQNDRELVVPRPRFVRGKVTDAATGKPIERFLVLTGHGDAAGEDLEWEFPRALAGAGGSYEAKLGAEYRGFERYVRIEADGYLPERSRAFPESEPEWDRAFDFKLRRGEGLITGTVRQPDGSPLAGAEVVLLTSLTPIADGRLPGAATGRVAKTGPDGGFRFPSIDTAFTVVVLTDAGVAERTSDRFAAGSEMTIEPWARIEGTYRIGAKPGAGEKLALARDQVGRRGALTQYNGDATPDDAGRFVFERVRPGVVAVAQTVKQGSFTSLYRLTDPLEVMPGKTTKLAIGGSGRPVTGHLEMPPDLAKQVDRSWSEILLIADRRAHRAYIGKHTAEDGFRFEDVPAGSYQLLVLLKASPSEPQSGFAAAPIATARRKIAVEEMPGGRSDEPLNIGAIPLEPAVRR